MEMKLKTAFMRGLFSKTIEKLVKDKTGLDLDIFTENLEIKPGASNTVICVNARIIIENDDLSKFILKKEE